MANEIDLKKVQKLSDLLDRIKVLTDEYQVIAKDMTSNEVLLGGAIVIGCYSPFSDHRLMGSLGSHILVEPILNDIITTHQQNKQRLQQKVQPSLTPFVSDRKIN